MNPHNDRQFLGGHRFTGKMDAKRLIVVSIVLLANSCSFSLQVKTVLASIPGNLALLIPMPSNVGSERIRRATATGGLGTLGRLGVSLLNTSDILWWYGGPPS